MYKHDFNETLFDEFITDLTEELNSYMSPDYWNNLESDAWHAAVEYIIDTIKEDGPDYVDEDQATERAWESVDSSETLIYTAKCVDEWVRRGMPEPEEEYGSITDQITRAVFDDVNPHSIGAEAYAAYTEALDSLREDARYVQIIDGLDAASDDD